MNDFSQTPISSAVFSTCHAEGGHNQPPNISSAYISPVTSTLFPSMNRMAIASPGGGEPLLSRHPHSPPVISQTLGFPVTRHYPSSSQNLTGEFSPSSRSPSLNRRVQAGWSPAPSPNSITRQLGFGPRGSGGGSSSGGTGGVDQIRREFRKSLPGSPTQSPISDSGGSPISLLDLDTDLIMGSPSADEAASPARLSETLRNSASGDGDSSVGGSGRGRRLQRTRVVNNSANVRSKNRQKHNEAEMRRRRKLNESFDELAGVCGTQQAQKATVLKTAIFQIQSLEKMIHVTSQRVKALKRLNTEDPIPPIQIPKIETKEPELLPEPLVKKEEPLTTATHSDIDCKHTNDETFRSVSHVSPPSLPEVKKEMDLQAQLGLAWKDIHDLVEYKKRTSQIISNVLQLAQLHINHQSIFSSSIVMELLCLADGKILECNNLFCNYFGCTREQAARWTFYELTHPDSLANTYLIIQSLLSGSTQVQQALHKFKTADGRTVTCQIILWLATNENRDPYLRVIMEPAPIAPPRSASPRPGTSSPRLNSRTLPSTPLPEGIRSPRLPPSRLTTASGRRLSGTTSPLNSPNLDTRSPSPLLRIRRQTLEDLPALSPVPTSTNPSNCSNYHQLLDSPSARLRQLRDKDCTMGTDQNNQKNQNLNIRNIENSNPLLDLPPPQSLVAHLNSQATSRLAQNKDLEGLPLSPPPQTSRADPFSPHGAPAS